MSLGEENLLRSTSDIELTAVPISLQYSLVKDVYTSFQTFDVVVYYTSPEGNEREYYEGSNFSIDLSGKAITLFSPVYPNSTLTVSYVEAISGDTRVKQSLVGALDGTNKLFYLPNNESALGYYKVLASGIVSLTQSGSTYPTDFALASGLTYSGISQDIILNSGVN